MLVPADVLGTLDHTMIRVENLDTALDWYTTHLDYREKGRWEGEAFTTVYLGPDDVHEEGALLELTYNHDGRTYTHGDAWSHLAVRTDDASDAYQQLVTAGVEEHRAPDASERRPPSVTDPDGHEIRIVERDSGAEWSLDHTAVRVGDADDAIGWYVRKLGYDLVGREESDGTARYSLAPADAADEAMAVELVRERGDRSREVGDAWGHLAVRASDLEGAWETLTRRGAESYRDPESCNYSYAFTRTGDGHEIEIVPR